VSFHGIWIPFGTAKHMLHRHQEDGHDSKGRETLKLARPIFSSDLALASLTILCAPKIHCQLDFGRLIVSTPPTAIPEIKEFSIWHW
jgi:hypothetical protein